MVQQHSTPFNFSLSSNLSTLILNIIVYERNKKKTTNIHLHKIYYRFGINLFGSKLINSKNEPWVHTDEWNQSVSMDFDLIPRYGCFRILKWWWWYSFTISAQRLDYCGWRRPFSLQYVWLVLMLTAAIRLPGKRCN